MGNKITIPISVNMKVVGSAWEYFGLSNYRSRNKNKRSE